MNSYLYEIVPEKRWRRGYILLDTRVPKIYIIDYNSEIEGYPSRVTPYIMEQIEENVYVKELLDEELVLNFNELTLKHYTNDNMRNKDKLLKTDNATFKSSIISNNFKQFINMFQERYPEFTFELM